MNISEKFLKSGGSVVKRTFSGKEYLVCQRCKADVKTAEDLDQRQGSYEILSQTVIAVAKAGARGDDWAAYVDSVLGLDVDLEVTQVAEHGQKLSQRVAEAIFPHWKGDKMKWRD